MICCSDTVTTTFKISKSFSYRCYVDVALVHHLCGEFINLSYVPCLCSMFSWNQSGQLPVTKSLNALGNFSWAINVVKGCGVSLVFSIVTLYHFFNDLANIWSVSQSASIVILSQNYDLHLRPPIIIFVKRKCLTYKSESVEIED